MELRCAKFQRVPQRLKEAKLLIHQSKQVEWVSLDNGYHGYWSTSQYGDVPQRWLLVKSSQAKAREEHILNKAVSKSTQVSLKRFNRLCRKAFSCAADAKIALQEWIDAQEFITLYNEAISEEKNVLNEEDQDSLLNTPRNSILLVFLLPH